MKLSHQEKESAVWRHIERELKGQLAIQREKNDGALDAQETAKVRGRIAQIKLILSWAENDPSIAE